MSETKYEEVDLRAAFMRKGKAYKVKFESESQFCKYINTNNLEHLWNRLHLISIFSFESKEIPEFPFLYTIQERNSFYIMIIGQIFHSLTSLLAIYFGRNLVSKNSCKSNPLKMFAWNKTMITLVCIGVFIEDKCKFITYSWFFYYNQ